MIAFLQNPKTKLISMICLIIVLAALPLLNVPGVWILYLFLFFIYLSLANMWNLLAGYSGLISLCQPAFIGLAGYTMVIITWNGLPYYWGIIVGGIVSGLFALLISTPVFRLSGIYFAIGTLVVPEVLRVIFLLWRPVGGALHGAGAGYRLKGLEALTMTEIYWMALVIGIGSTIILRLILRSSLGLGLAAIRDNSSTAASSGIHVFKLKLFSFVVGAVVTGIAGSIFFIYQKYIEPTSAFSIRWTMILMLSAVIGGLGVETGPIIGTIVVVFLHFFLAKYAGWSLLLQGIMLIIVMLLLPRGIMGFAIKKSE
jgi:branched-chain amino acid transport system permease protein